MKNKLKLTELQKDRIKRAHYDAAIVLREIRAKPLAGNALTDMKVLEQAVQCLELFLLVP